ncbi:hypothetical protein BZL29_2263 [Mycobacterium kansasii]|uniref:Uncharacterized protein n=1 Tax=Mycobacterium kansasii TaxID=1768 RepID=A0A1V3XN69_MYCKA|nr:hypothetical protein BZL29_2263 [Mycobacterium kansasii]
MLQTGFRAFPLRLQLIQLSRVHGGSRGGEVDVFVRPNDSTKSTPTWKVSALMRW